MRRYQIVYYDRRNVLVYRGRVFTGPENMSDNLSKNGPWNRIYATYGKNPFELLRQDGFTGEVHHWGFISARHRP